MMFEQRRGETDNEYRSRILGVPIAEIERMEQEVVEEYAHRADPGEQAFLNALLDGHEAGDYSTSGFQQRYSKERCNA